MTNWFTRKGLTVGGLEAFGAQVLADLWYEFDAETQERIGGPVPTWQESERETVYEFLAWRATAVIGRQSELERLERLCLGSGQADSMVHCRVRELAQVPSIPEPIDEHAPTDKLRQAFHDLLRRSVATRHVVLVISALNQFVSVSHERFVPPADGTGRPRQCRNEHATRLRAPWRVPSRIGTSSAGAPSAPLEYAERCLHALLTLVAGPTFRVGPVLNLGVAFRIASNHQHAMLTKLFSQSLLQGRGLR